MEQLSIKIVAGFGVVLIVGIGIAVMRFLSRVPRPRRENKPGQFRGYMTPPDLP